MPARSGADPEPQWPPRSPHEALLSTPKGRERLRRMAERASPSPSPTKRGRLTPALTSRPGNSRRNITEEDEMDLDDDEDEEDEEMLQLKLEAIQAKLKLKKLQSAKAKKANGRDLSPSRPESAPIPDISIASRGYSRTESIQSGTRLRSQSQVEVQVPASPVRKAQPAQEDKSPSRVRLGIDKGIKAKDISLKRAPSFRRNTTENQNSQHGTYLRRAHTPAQGTSEQPTKQERPLTFSERLAQARTDEISRHEKRERVKQARSNAFELGRQEMEQFKSNAKEIPDVPIKPEEFSREEVMAGGRLRRSNTMPTLRRPTQDVNRSGSSLGGTIDSQTETESQHHSKVAPDEVPEEEASAFEPYSSVHLSKRVIPHSILTRNLTGKKTYVIKDILKHVKAPEFQLPEIEQDIVIFGILASKSEPRAHKTTNSNLMEKSAPDPNKGKYMVLQLVDLQWELELFLFNSGFDRYWKLTPGTLLAILNPTIMPPPPGRTDTGRFSLVINSGHDTILEIGTARDLGFCKSIKKDGEYCNGWVNRKRTEFCEFHMNMGLAKHRQARQDVNAFNTGLGPRSGGGNSKKNPLWEQKNIDKKKGKGGGANYDRSTQSQWFISKPSAATMLDNEVLGGQVADRVERSETLRRRLATEEKERELMKKLGKMGSGAGKEYMLKGGFTSSARSGSSLSTAAPGPSDEKQVDVKSLGLVPGKGKEPKMHLSPIKRKRGEGNFLATGSSDITPKASGGGSKPALGWGGNLKDKLARMKDGEKLRGNLNFNLNSNSNSSALEESRDVSTAAADRSLSSSLAGSSSLSMGMRSPARKKTRFVTEKGIREAGRESLGNELQLALGTGPGTSGSGGATAVKGGRRMVVFDDDDDELEILR
ncbi:hypothetical protein M426DRAFT_321559 [Hypoxylon sp. CI-4A]|nr:hypothetical protein M426DRAFT_321559 [Hypoxylon sp. CI-4A]